MRRDGSLGRMAWLLLTSFAAFGHMRPAFGGPSDAIRLTYEAPAGCPDQAALLERIQARLPLRVTADTEPVPSFAIVVRPRGDVLVGEIVSTSDTGEAATREVTGANCSDVVDALALIVTMALAPSPRPEVAASVDAGVGVEVDASEPSPVAVTAPPPSTQPEPAGERSAEARRGTEYRLAAAAQAEITLGYVPAALLGTAARVQLFRARAEHLGAPAVALGVSAIHPTERDLAEGNARLSWIMGQLFLCPASLTLPASLGLLFCGRLDLGQVRAEGSEIAHQRTQKLLWSSVGPIAEMSWIPVEPLVVDAQAALLFPLTTYRFIFDPDTVIYGPSRVGLSVSLSAGVLFW